MGVKEQGVFWSKSRLCKVFFEAKCVKLLRSKGFLLSKVFFEAKCASAFLTLEYKIRILGVKVGNFLYFLKSPLINLESKIRRRQLFQKTH